MTKFYERFSILLKENPTLKQQDIVIATGIDKTSISKYCNGKAEPESDNLFALSEMFDVSPSWLKGNDVPRKSKSNMSKSPNQSEYIVFPVIGEIAAGYDKIAIEDWDGDTIPIHIDNLKGRPKNDFMVLEVKGNSMFPEFQNGDKVLILKQSSMDHSGQVGAVIYGECATLKKVEYKNGENWLKLVPINPNYETAIIEGDAIQDCWILGIPKMLIREYE